MQMYQEYYNKYHILHAHGFISSSYSISNTIITVHKTSFYYPLRYIPVINISKYTKAIIFWYAQDVYTANMMWQGLSRHDQLTASPECREILSPACRGRDLAAKNREGLSGQK